MSEYQTLAEEVCAEKLKQAEADRDRYREALWWRGHSRYCPADFGVLARCECPLRALNPAPK